MQILQAANPFDKTVPTTSGGGLDVAVTSLMESLSQYGVRSDRVAGILQDGTAPDCDLEAYDLVHGHDWYSSDILKHAKESGIPTAFTSHLPLRGGFTYRDLGVEWKRKYLMEEKAMKLADIVIAPSRFVGKYLTEEYGISSKKIRIINHGVMSNIFTPSLSPLPREDKLLFVGRITQQKGLEILIRAIPHLIKTRPSVSLKIIGTGPRRNAAEDLIASLGLGERVKLEGFKEHLEIVSDYQTATTLVMPSLFEPFGLVGLEALACGCPAFTIAPTGAEYALDEETTNTVSIERFGSDLGNFLATLDRSSGAVMERAKRAMEYSPSITARNHLNVYKELTKCNKSR